MDCSPPGSLSPWVFPVKNTGVGCHFLLQGIFLTLSLPHLTSSPVSPTLTGWFLALSHQGNPFIALLCVLNALHQPHSICQSNKYIKYCLFHEFFSWCLQREMISLSFELPIKFAYFNYLFCDIVIYEKLSFSLLDFKFPEEKKFLGP